MGKCISNLNSATSITARDTLCSVLDESLENNPRVLKVWIIESVISIRVIEMAKIASSDLWMLCDKEQCDKERTGLRFGRAFRTFPHFRHRNTIQKRMKRTARGKQLSL